MTVHTTKQPGIKDQAQGPHKASSQTLPLFALRQCQSQAWMKEGDAIHL